MKSKAQQKTKKEKPAPDFSLEALKPTCLFHFNITKLLQRHVFKESTIFISGFYVNFSC